MTDQLIKDDIELDYQPVFEDEIGVAVNSSLKSTIRAWRAVASIAGILAIGGGVSSTVLALRRPIVRYIRIDDMKRATALQYSDLSYTPEAGEIRTWIQEWTKYKYERLKDSVEKTYNLNYYFMDKPLAAQDRIASAREHIVAGVATGEVPENEIAINSIQFTELTKAPKSEVIASGAAQIDFLKIYAPDGAGVSRKVHMLVAVRFTVDPTASSDERDPNYQIYNPLGLLITDRHETVVAN